MLVSELYAKFTLARVSEGIDEATVCERQRMERTWCKLCDTLLTQSEEFSRRQKLHRAGARQSSFATVSGAPNVELTALCDGKGRVHAEK